MPERVPFAASSIGSYWWEGGLLLKKSIAQQGIDIDLDDRVADYHNVLSVADGKNLLGITMPQFLDWSQRRLGIFADKEIPELRVVAVLNLPVWLIAAVDRSAGYTALSELARDHFPWKVLLPPPHNQVGVYIERIMREHGLTRESIVSWGGADLRPTHQRSAAEQAARDRSTETTVLISRTAELAKSDATNGFFLYINSCSTWGRDMTVLRDLRFLRFDEKILDSINAEWGGTTITLPARLFPGADEDLPVVGWRHHYIYGKPDVPDDLVRAVLKALESETILDNAQGFSYSGFRPQLAPKTLKLHRATEEYYRKREQT